MNRLAFSFLVMSFVSPQDEYFSQQWYLKNSGFNIRRDITEISSYAVLGKVGADIHYPFEFVPQIAPRKPVVVAILDTGVDIDHPELSDQLGHIPPKNSPDKDGNGYKGDCAGWNFASNSSIEGDNQVYDDTGHGTHLSGLIAAKLDQYGIRGISDQIKILPVKIFNKYEIPNHPLRPKMKMMDRIQKGLEYAISKNVDVINLSLGWPSVLDSPKIRDLFDLAAKKNILIVAAAGNNSQHTTIFPCSYSSVLCVGATTVDGTVAPFSNYGGNVDLMAPGENILSTIPKKITPLYFDQDGYDFKNGTSQASPLVAGSAAFLKLVLGNISVNELKARLLSSAAKTNGDLSSLYGDLNLEVATAHMPDQFLYPNLKELNTVEVSYPDGRFSFEIKVDKFLPGVVDLGNIALGMGDVHLDQSDYPISFQSQQNEQIIRISGIVQDLQSSSTQVLSMELHYGEHRYTFKKELTLALNAERVGTKSYFNEKINADSLRTVDDSMKLSDQSLFYTQDLSINHLAITFYQSNDQLNQKLFTVLKAPDLKLLATAFVNKNLISIEFYDDKNKRLIFDFWDLARSALVKTLEMVPDSAVLSLTQSTFFNTSEKLQAVALENGIIPPFEANKSVWLNSQTLASDHLYYFEETEGKIITKMLDDESFKRIIAKKFQLRFDDDIAPLAVLTQGRAPSIDTLFVIGKGYQRKILLIQFSGRDQFIIKREYVVPGAVALKQITFLGKTILVSQERKDAYQLFDLETGKFITYEWSDRNDDLMGPIVSVSKDQILAQTQNHFVVLGQGQQSSIPLKRFSFLPGELFSEMFAPVEVSTSQQQLPGLFIDGTLISEKHLGVVLWDGEKIVKPIYFQEKLPDRCRVMNPQRVKGVYQLVLLCNPENGLQYLLNRKLVYAQ